LPFGCISMPKPGRMRPRSSAILNYMFAVLVIAAAFACVSLLGQLLEAAPPVSLFLCAIIFVAWFAGLGPAVLASALSVLAFGYFYLLPINSLTLASRDLPRIVLFGIASLFIASVSAAQRKTAASLLRARDQLQDAVHDLETLNEELLRENVERKAAEQMTRKSEAYLDEAQQLSRTGTVAWNIATGDIVWSKEAYRILGIDQTVEPTVALIMRHIPPEDRELVQAELDRARRGAEDLDYEHRWLTPGGNAKQLHVRAHRVRYASGEDEIIGALMDVTEAREAQAALAAAQQHLAHANRVATLGELAASIAHEVNQPLAAIVTNGDATLRWLHRTAPDIDEVRRGVEEMIGDARRASDVVNRIRTLSKKNQPAPVLVDINEVISEVIKVVDREIASHQVSLRVELAPALPLVLGDRVQLQQVIINLAVNGIQAMADVENRARNLLIRSNLHQSDQVVVAVQDSGRGFDPENASTLFDAFYTTKPSGMGIGLSICRTIIESHGGRIWASSHAGTGAIFQFAIPAQPERQPALAETPDNHAAGRRCGQATAAVSPPASGSTVLAQDAA
jgi:signal transduction histidine kinase